MFINVPVGDCVQVSLREGETQENLLRRFRSAVQRAGILQDVKRRRYFVSKSEKARLAARRALRRARRRAARQR
ncbi:MAG TPA: 30S ribosomal protein S21 [Dehalococcoidia bacterium]|nr:30S ribosomal protein S21 [Dehalococcoidia bacterium]